MTGEPILRLDGLVRDYVLPRRSLLRPAPRFRALHGVSLEVRAGESFGIVGESGCGKSTLARAVLALETPSAGTVEFMGEDLFALSASRLRGMRRHMQMVFQDPYGSLDPRHKVGRIVAEPLDMLEAGLGRRERRRRVAESLGRVRLNGSDADKYPHEFSGGQRQRIAIARALITHPRLIVADEPVSALDVSVQAQVLNLMSDLRRDQGLTYLFISHDLSVVRHVTDRVAVMYLGRIVEQGETAQVFAQPRHPYTRALLDAVPRPDPARFRHRHRVQGEAAATPSEPEGTAPAGGCPFAPRCPEATDRCRAEDPALEPRAGGRLAACHFA
ncbi:MAG: ATP-binding cassette domain-containing protein [Hyphomicrobiales bacterium]|nr:ATP-binding cassette domain-containing protein [Hyphomicrobiales bacterium]MCP5373925.1 ATP-binding cassette domain-containing protein [Hyphomicrobiales bacterium]